MIKSIAFALLYSNVVFVSAQLSATDVLAIVADINSGSFETFPPLDDCVLGGAPITLSGAFGGFVGGKLIVCGGYPLPNPFRQRAYTRCYKYNPINDNFEYIQDLPVGLFDAKARKWNETHLIITGGQFFANVPQQSARMENDITYFFDASTETVVQAPTNFNLPEKLTKHDAIPLGNQEFLLVGSAFPTKRAYKFSNMQFNRIADTLAPRSTFSGGVVVEGSTRRVVIASGTDTLTTEVYDIDNDIWTPGPTIALGANKFIRSAGSVNVGNDWYLVGGSDEPTGPLENNDCFGDECRTQILKFSLVGGQVVITDAGDMKVPRKFPIVDVVPKSFFCNCN